MIARLEKMKNRKGIQHKEYQSTISNNTILLRNMELEIGEHKSQILLTDFFEEEKAN